MKKALQSFELTTMERSTRANNNENQGNFAPNEFESQYGCPSTDIAKSQMQHFANVDGFNVFRLPVPWQSLVNNDLCVWFNFSGVGLGKQ